MYKYKDKKIVKVRVKPKTNQINFPINIILMSYGESVQRKNVIQRVIYWWSLRRRCQPETNFTAVLRVSLTFAAVIFYSYTHKLYRLS